MSGGTGGTQNTQNSIAQGQLAISQQQQAQANKISGIVDPGLGMAESYYQAVASGDPTKIMAAIGPAVGQIGSQTQQAKNSITSSTPRGGAQDLALAEANISKAGQVGNLQTQAYTGAFPALASLFQGGSSAAIGQVANAISAASGAGTTEAQIGQEQSSGKASTMGLLGSLAGVGGQLGAASILA